MTPTLSHEARVRAELATRDTVFGLALRLADLLEGSEEYESPCACVCERNQLRAPRCGWCGRSETRNGSAARRDIAAYKKPLQATV